MSKWGKRGRVAGIGLLLILLLLVVSIWFFNRSVPINTAYSDLVSAVQLGAALRTNPVATARERTHFVEVLSNALTREIVVPVKYSQEWITEHLPHITAIKAAGNHLDDLSREAVTNCQPAQAVQLQILRLGLGRATTPGLLIDYLVGTAVEWGAVEALENLAESLDEPACREALAALRDRPPSAFRMASRRERTWIIVGSGWWRDWEMATSLPSALWNPGGSGGFGFGLSNPSKRERGLDERYQKAQTLLSQRLEALRQSNPAADAARDDSAIPPAAQP